MAEAQNHNIKLMSIQMPPSLDVLSPLGVETAVALTHTRHELLANGVSPETLINTARVSVQNRLSYVLGQDFDTQRQWRFVKILHAPDAVGNTQQIPYVIGEVIQFKGTDEVVYMQGGSRRIQSLDRIAPPEEIVDFIRLGFNTRAHSHTTPHHEFLWEIGVDSGLEYEA